MNTIQTVLVELRNKEFRLASAIKALELLDSFADANLAPRAQRVLSPQAKRRMAAGQRRRWKLWRQARKAAKRG